MSCYYQEERLNPGPGWGKRICGEELLLTVQGRIPPWETPSGKKLTLSSFYQLSNCDVRGQEPYNYSIQGRIPGRKQKGRKKSWRGKPRMQHWFPGMIQSHLWVTFLVTLSSSASIQEAQTHHPFHLSSLSLWLEHAPEQGHDPFCLLPASVLLSLDHFLTD